MTEYDNIVLVVADTLSAFHMGCYSYERNTTPFLDSLAEDNLMFRFAYSNSSWTVPSHASMFSGELATEHGSVHGNLDFTSDSFVEDIKEEGFNTIGASCNHLISEDLGFDRGFDTLVSGGVDVKMRGMGFENLQALNSSIGGGSTKEKGLELFKKSITNFDPLPLFEGLRYQLSDKPERPAEYMVDLVKREIEEEDKNFVFLNYTDPHLPYNPPDKYAKIWLDDAVSLRDQHVKDFRENNEDRFKWNKEPENPEVLTSLYDAELRYLDDKIRELYTHLDEKLENMLFIFVSDHGENIGDYGLQAHQCGVWEKLIRVPLIVAGEGLDGEVEGNFSLKDIQKIIFGEEQPENLTSEKVHAHYRPVIGSSDSSEEDYLEEDLPYALNASNCVVSKRKGFIENSQIEDFGFKARKKGFSEENILTQVEQLQEHLIRFDEDKEGKSLDEKVKENLEDLGYI